MNPNKVALTKTFRRNFISPKPLKIASNVNPKALNGCEIKTIKNMP